MLPRLPLVLVAFVLFFASAAGASSPEAELTELAHTTAEQRATFQTDYMKKKLGLSAEQAKQVEKINLETAHAADPVLKGDEGFFHKVHTLRGIQKTQHENLQKVLTAKQMDELEKIGPDMREAMFAKFADAKGDGKGDE